MNTKNTPSSSSSSLFSAAAAATFVLSNCVSLLLGALALDVCVLVCLCALPHIVCVIFFLFYFCFLLLQLEYRNTYTYGWHMNGRWRQHGQRIQMLELAIHNRTTTEWNEAMDHGN